jgi:uncharacterized membrane protein
MAAKIRRQNTLRFIRVARRLTARRGHPAIARRIPSFIREERVLPMNESAIVQNSGAPSREFSSMEIPRWGALLGGGALALFGLTRRSTAGLALAAAGGALAYLGSQLESEQAEPIARATVVVSCSPEEAFQFWRKFENLPRFMRHLDSVTETGNGRSRWVAAGPLGHRVEWEAEIVSESANQSIVWRSLPGSEVGVDGRVDFRSAPAHRGTLINVLVHYRPPAGAIGKSIAKMLGKDPSFLMLQDLRRFKALIETGEIPTVEGQSHGPRDLMTGVARLANPDYSIPRDAGVVKEVSEQRRAS